MKITKQQLRSIIEEVVKRNLNEFNDYEDSIDYPDPPKDEYNNHWFRLDDGLEWLIVKVEALHHILIEKFPELEEDYDYNKYGYNYDLCKYDHEKIEKIIEFLYKRKLWEDEAIERQNEIYKHEFGEEQYARQERYCVAGESKKIKVGDMLFETGRNLNLKYIGLNEDRTRAKFVDKSNHSYSITKEKFIEGVKNKRFLIK